MGSGEEKKQKGVLSESFIVGVIAILFMIVGYQTSMFIHRAAVTKIAANRDVPDTVYIYKTSEPSGTSIDAGNSAAARVRADAGKTVSHMYEERHDAVHGVRASAVRKNVPRSKVESFHFNPNTVSIDDLCRLGFSLKQAQAIDNYRKSGGIFRRKTDFAKSYVVADSVYLRLEPFIDIPLVDLNAADSAALDALPGIGGWFASRIIEHRALLGGYSYKEQLMDIWNFDREKYEGLCDLITVSTNGARPYALWTLPADSLVRHPYIKDYETAKAIVLFRDNNSKESLTVRALEGAGVISKEIADKLERCVLEPAP